jgi:hypothetical protein
MQRVLTAWAPHTPCRDLPGILVAGLRRAGIQPLRQTAIPILNSSYNPTSFSYWVAQVIKPFVVSRRSVTEEEPAEWFDELAKLEENGAYFFCITPVLTEAVKVVWVELSRPGAGGLVVLVIHSCRWTNRRYSPWSGNIGCLRFTSSGVCGGGGLMSYGADLSTVYWQPTHLVDGLLRGAKADDLPVEQAIRFELIANLKTAKALGRFRKRCARVDVVIQ